MIGGGAGAGAAATGGCPPAASLKNKVYNVNVVKLSWVSCSSTFEFSSPSWLQRNDAKHSLEKVILK